MRTTADIAAIVTIILLAGMVYRKKILLEREKRASRLLSKSNKRLFDRLDEMLNES